MHALKSFYQTADSQSNWHYTPRLSLPGGFRHLSFLMNSAERRCEARPGFGRPCEANRRLVMRRELTFLGIVDRHFLPTADTETAPSIPWFAATQGPTDPTGISLIGPRFAQHRTFRALWLETHPLPTIPSTGVIDRPSPRSSTADNHPPPLP